MNHPKKRQPVLLTQRALADLCEIEEFSVLEWGRKTGEKYLDEIEAAISRIQETPGILRLEPEFSPGLYFYRIKKHFLVCDLQADFVIVLTLIHTSMDLPSRLLELEPRLAAEASLLRSRLPGRSVD